MEDNKAFVQAIVDRMKTVLGFSKDKELATYLGGARSTPAAWKLRGSIPIAECIALAEEKGVSLDYLILGRGADPTEAASGEGELLADQAPTFFAEVPAFDMATFMRMEDAPDMFWKLPRGWIEGQGLSPIDTIVVFAVGDSMTPTIEAGQMVVVDRRPRDTDGVFLVRFGDALRFKRVQRMVDGSLRLSNDNPAYAVEIVPPGDEGKIEIIGHCHAAVCLVR